MKEEKQEVSAEMQSEPPKIKVRKTKHRGLKIFAIIAVAFIILFTVAIMMLDIIVADAVRTITPKITGTPVELKSVSIKILEAKFELNGLKIGNPEGYSYPNAFELNHLVFHLDASTIADENIIVKEITTDGMVVDFEPKLDGSNNLWELKSNIEGFIKQFVPEETAEESQKSNETEVVAQDETAVEQNVIIDNFNASNVSLVFGKNIKIPLLDMSIKGAGMPVGEFINVFFVELFKSITGQLKTVGSGAVATQIDSFISESTKEGKVQLDNATDAIKNLFSK